MQTVFTKNLDINTCNQTCWNNIGQHFLPYRAPLYSMLGAISYQNKDRKNAKFHLTRHWLEFANQWLEVTWQFLWLDPDWTRPSHDSFWLDSKKF